MLELKNEILDAFKRIAELQVLVNQEMDVVHRLVEKFATKCILTKGERDGHDMDHRKLGTDSSGLVVTGATTEISK